MTPNHSYNPLSQQTNNQPYEVLVHTPDILVIQTNAGMDLSNSSSLDANKQSARNSFGEFNLGLHVNDEPQRVLSNRAQLLASVNHYLVANQPQINAVDELGTVSNNAVDSIHWLNQIHSNKVVRVEDNESNVGLSLTPNSADALVASQPNTALAIMTADCVPIVIYHDQSKQVAAIHAGWQGLANGVIASTCKQLNLNPVSDRSLSNKDNISLKPQAWIGACISQPCYEVSTDVVEKLLAGCREMGMDSEEVRAKIVGEHDNPDKAWLDLPALAALQLAMFGIQVNNTKPQDSSQDNSEEQSSSAYACSYSNPRYYSYRHMTHAGEKNTGRMALLIMRLR